MKSPQQISQGDILGLIDGNRSSFENIYVCFKDRIYYYALKLTKSEELSEEIVQDVFVKIWKNRKKIDLQYNFSSFLFRITHNHAINLLKRIAYERVARDRISRFTKTSSTSTEDQVILNEYMGIMNSAFELLPQKRKNIFDLSRNKGVSHDEIAEMMGISKNTVKSQLVKATKFIKNYVALNTGLAL